MLRVREIMERMRRNSKSCISEEKVMEAYSKGTRNLPPGGQCPVCHQNANPRFVSLTPILHVSLISGGSSWWECPTLLLCARSFEHTSISLMKPPCAYLSHSPLMSGNQALVMSRLIATTDSDLWGEHECVLTRQSPALMSDYPCSLLLSKGSAHTAPWKQCKELPVHNDYDRDIYQHGENVDMINQSISKLADTVSLSIDIIRL